jgi:uncharacterized protein
MTPVEVAAPVAEPERIASIDVLRGVALLGILLLNIRSFSMPGAAYMNPTAFGDLTGANYWVWYLTQLLGDQKFMSIFSMLFGAGIVLMTTRAEQRSGHSAGVHYRRMAWLILFGLLHAHLIWYGDILYTYGMCGLIVYLFRRLPPAWLILLGVVALLVPFILNLGFYGLYQVLPEEGQQQWLSQMQSSWNPTDAELQRELDAYRGGWLDQAPHRSAMALFFQTLIFAMWVGWRAGGLMLIGMALFKTRVFSAARSSGFYLVVALAGLALGIPLTMFSIHLSQRAGWPAIEGMYLYGEWHYWGSFFQSLGYVALVMLLCKAGVLGFLQQALAAVGRMAFTNYIAQSVICTFIMYGYGFGQFGSFDRVQQLLVVAAVCVAQLLVSPLWLHHFRFGPLEWLWRTLTYGRLQSMRRT